MEMYVMQKIGSGGAFGLLSTEHCTGALSRTYLKLASSRRKKSFGNFICKGCYPQLGRISFPLQTVICKTAKWVVRRPAGPLLHFKDSVWREVSDLSKCKSSCTGNRWWLTTDHRFFGRHFSDSWISENFSHFYVRPPQKPCIKHLFAIKIIRTFLHKVTKSS